MSQTAVLSLLIVALFISWSAIYSLFRNSVSASQPHFKRKSCPQVFYKSYGLAKIDGIAISMNGSSTLKVPLSERVRLKVRRLSVAVKHKNSSRDIEKRLSEAENKKILDDVTFDLESGQLLALMGGSGCGKTTLLNVMSQSVNPKNKNLLFTGSLEYLVGDESTKHKKVRSAYLLQMDYFLPGLTVYETLWYQAELRLATATTMEKETLIESLLDTLELSGVRDNIILGFSKQMSTLSGGEQRRVSLAIQLLNKPSLLFLDEPTTGLDASSSLKLIQVLKKLTQPNYGLTIILSIHQPRIEVSVLFDKICLLTRGGRVIYYGNFADTVPYISLLKSQLTDECPENTGNFLEFIMALSVKDTSSKDKEKASEERINRLVSYWKSSGAYSDVLSDQPLDYKSAKKQFEKNAALFVQNRETKVSFWKELIVLTKRNFLLTRRDTLSLLAMNGGSIFLAFITGWMFYKPHPDLAGIRSLISTLYVVLETLGFTFMFIELERLWKADGVCFLREYKENVTSIPGFILSRRLAKLLLEDFPAAFFFSIVTYFMWGLRLSENSSSSNDASYFFIFFAIAFLTELISTGVVMFSFAATSDLLVSALLISAFYQLQNSACGYFVNAASMPVYVRWTKYIAYFWYGFGALVANQFTDWQGDCPYDDDAHCMEYEGNYQIDVLGYPKGWIAEPIGIMVAWLFGFYILTAIFLRFKNTDLSVAKVRTNKDEKGSDGETSDIESREENNLEESKEISHDPLPESEGLNVKIRDIYLSCKMGGKFKLRKSTERIDILNGVSASFIPQKINVIMGPSGSGKTTLLNYIAGRIPRNSNYICSGRITLNEAKDVTPNEMSSISGYVMQQDNALIPTLTTRETLYFQAKLRLHKRDHPRIPQIIESLLRKMSLVDCADTPVGSEQVKGLSGGEKRRVSIAIQLLSRPRILFLDEPTSGLDSTTSLAILKCLRELCLEGTTIILTIHQPSEQLFNSFGTLLLLAKGGHTVYNGDCSKVERYFREFGYPLPYDKKIPDHVLDLVSQRLDEEKERTAERVQHLVSMWRSLQDKGEFVTEYSATYFSDIKEYRRIKSGFFNAFRVLLRRQSINLIRAKDVLISKAGQIMILSIIHALFFAPLHNTQEGISNRLGLIQEVLNLYFCGLLNNVFSYPTERNLFYQEYKDGIYGVLEFQLAYFFNEVVIELVLCIFFAVMIVFVVGLPRNPGMFFSMIFTGFVSVNCGESLGILINSLFSHEGLAVNLLTVLITLAIFMGGTMSLHMPVFFKAWNYINPMKYAVGICAKLGLANQLFSCATGDCTLRTGDEVLRYYNMDNNLPAFFGGLIACFVLYRLIGVTASYVRVRYYN